MKTATTRPMRPRTCRPASGPARGRGFTMVELMITITIVAILLTIGVPAYKNVTASNRVSTEINGLLYDMQYARSEAIKQGRPVTVCASWDGATCLGWVWWGAGWIVFEDQNGNQTVDPGEAILRTQPRLAQNDSLWPDTWFYAVTYNREGFATLVNTFGATQVTVHLHDGTWNNSFTRCLQINMVGQMTTERFGTGQCWW